MGRLKLQAGEHCPECGELLVEGVLNRTYEFQGKSMAVPMHGLWCTTPGCNEGIVDLRDLDQISVDGPADVLRDGLLDSGVTPQDMLADLRQRREAEGAP